MPLRRCTKRELSVFNGIEPNRLFEVFVNLKTNQAPAMLGFFRSRSDRREFAALSFTSSRDTIRRVA
jgi:hypothetical protein